MIAVLWPLIQTSVFPIIRLRYDSAVRPVIQNHRYSLALRRTLSALLLALLASVSSCAYLTDRGVDFLDQYRGVVGVGTGGGVRVSALGLIDTGLIFGAKPQASSLGWKYGRPLVSTGTARPTGVEMDQVYLFIATAYENWDYASHDYKLSRQSFFLLPVLFSWVDTTYRDEDIWYVPEEGVELEGRHYLWTGAVWRRNRYAMIHALDIEVEISILAYLDLGISPGEIIDFWLGIFTIDIAKDDGRIVGDEP